MTGFLKLAVLAVIVVVSLTGCKSADEKAQEHYENGLAFAEQGDFDRAIVEFRNVFQIDGSHREARYALAGILRNELNTPSRAYRQYLRLAEQFPEDLEARIALSEIAFVARNWDEVERHGAQAEQIAAEDPRVQAISGARGYRQAALDEDQSAIRARSREIAALGTEIPDNIIVRNIAIDTALRDGKFAAALSEIDWMLERYPNNQTYWRQRLAVLAQLEDADGIEKQLEEMVARFPDEVTHRQSLLRFYIERGAPEKAEAFLRSQVASASEDDNGPINDLLQFIGRVQGIEAMRAELDNVIAETDDPTRFRTIRAVLDFETGSRNEAIGELEGLLQDADPSEETRNAKIALARMLIATGNEVGARARVEEVLQEEASNVDALKMQATWQIQADDTDTAIANLRLALDENPDDAAAMTLMAQAYTRSGRPQLARDFLSLAVEASNNAPFETLRYARLLIDEERYRPAEDILLPALRLAPRNSDILIMLGELYMAMDDLGRVEQVVRTLRQIETPEAQQAAVNLEATRINEQLGVEDALSYLEGLSNEADATLSAQVALIRARLSVGETEAALKLTRELQAEAPDNRQISALLAAVESVSGNLETAEAIYRTLLEEDSNASALWLELIRTVARQGGADAANGLLDEALAAVPDDPNLLWAKASSAERDGDIDTAIDIYENLYARNSNSVVVANNLASLLTTYRDDEASLERAWTVARRFRDTDVPAMQDTYGWILHRRGDSQEALEYLEAAAAGLQGDPIVQYHLGQVYLALGQQQKAKAQFERVVALAAPADQRAQIETARAQVEALAAAIEAETVEN